MGHEDRRMRRALGRLTALLIPLLALLTLAGYHHYLLRSGVEVILPISGYDPRDLLAGHYLTYRIDYGIEAICSDRPGRYPGYICLEPQGFYADNPPAECARLISGQCRHGQFDAGIERYFIPEAEAEALDQEIRTGNAKIRLSVNANGQTRVKGLILESRQP